MENVVEIVSGEFPIDTRRPIFLEVPDGGSKKHISGISSFLSGSPANRGTWDASRIINLPIYQNPDVYAPEMSKKAKPWDGCPETVPVVTLAHRIEGYYCDHWRAQTVSVLPVWADCTSILLELDWYEGSLEECSNPEWHIRASPRSSLEDGVERLRKICRNRPLWEDCSFYVYVIPASLGSNLLGRSSGNSPKIWQKEWRYANHGDMLSALGKIVATIMELKIGDVSQKQS